MNGFRLKSTKSDRPEELLEGRWSHHTGLAVAADDPERVDQAACRGASSVDELGDSEAYATFRCSVSSDQHAV